MKKMIRGLGWVCGEAVDTDQIIPAQYLVYSMTKPEERKMYGHYAMSSVPPGEQGLPDGNMPYVEADAYTSKYSIMIAGANFGCGSSREHAPFAMAEAGCEAVVAESYARIFYRNAVDGGFLIPFEGLERLNDKISTGDEVEIDVAAGTLANLTSGETYLLRPLGDVADILDAGNIFEYARKSGMIPSV
ncbi:MAG TPA: 3-isopropylmalate dehydratase [Rhodothermales bacterium]|nr:3-isopropylmalate dehydratase [Rhodothermales bacterium]